VQAPVRQPRLTERGIVCLSSIDWEFNWQGHQQIMSTLAERGNHVLFVENTGVRIPNLRDLPRLVARVRNRLRSPGALRRERERLDIHPPMALPFPYSKVARAANRTILLRQIRRWMRATGVRKPILWTFLSTPLVLDLIQGIRPALSVYYCADDLPETSEGARKILQSETQLFREADLVFVTSERLRARAAGSRSQVDLFPFGVDLAPFERAREANGPPPQEIAALPRPMIGFVGEVKRWIDQALLIEVAARMPHASFVLVGPAGIDVSHLARCPNIHLLGPRPHTEVPHYLKAFDAAIIPYRLTSATEAIYPAKLNEYLAMGLPVVSTPIAELVRLDASHAGMIFLAGTAEEFARALGEALHSRTAEATARRVEMARGNSWALRIDRMIALVEEALAART
jgi:glycosyltransferase involved in cell wall biosynthesis